MDRTRQVYISLAAGSTAATPSQTAFRTGILLRFRRKSSSSTGVPPVSHRMAHETGGTPVLLAFDACSSKLFVQSIQQIIPTKDSGVRKELP